VFAPEPENATATLPNLELLLPESQDALATLPNLADDAAIATERNPKPAGTFPRWAFLAIA
jgi:hypothetical protein